MVKKIKDMYKPEVLEDRTFYAGENRVLWRAEILKYPNGSVAVRLSRVGARRVTKIQFSFFELPELVENLSKLRAVISASWGEKAVEAVLGKET